VTTRSVQDTAEIMSATDWSCIS